MQLLTLVLSGSAAVGVALLASQAMGKEEEGMVVQPAAPDDHNGLGGIPPYITPVRGPGTTYADIVAPALPELVSTYNDWQKT